MSVAAGWYPDNQNPQMERWWDGNSWTEHTRVTPGEVSHAPQNVVGVDVSGVGLEEVGVREVRAGEVGVEQTSAEGVTAGWYSDPWGASVYRWWDGSAWTEHVDEGVAAPVPDDLEAQNWGRQTGLYGETSHTGTDAAAVYADTGWAGDRSAGAGGWDGGVPALGAENTPMPVEASKRVRQTQPKEKRSVAGVVAGVSAKLGENTRTVIAGGAGLALVLAAVVFTGGESGSAPEETDPAVVALVELCEKNGALYREVQAAITSAPSSTVGEATVITGRRLVDAPTLVSEVVRSAAPLLGEQAQNEAAVWVGEEEARRPLVVAYQEAVTARYGAGTLVTDVLGAEMGSSSEARALNTQSEKVRALETGALRAELSERRQCSWVGGALR
jgi:hypothetical protein